MKQFFENYGAVALGILALLVLIAMITPVGNIIKTSLQGTVQTLSTKIDDQTDTMTESMNAAFTNTTDFTGGKDGKLYINGHIPNCLKDYTLSVDGMYLVHDATGQTIRIGYDLNYEYNGVRYTGGNTGLYFDIYKNNVLTTHNVSDALVLSNVYDNDVFSVKLSSSMTNYEIQGIQQMTTNELLALWLKNTGENTNLSGIETIWLGWYVQVVDK